MNAYDDLPPLSLAALGSPIRTIYSFKEANENSVLLISVPTTSHFPSKVTRSLQRVLKVKKKKRIWQCKCIKKLSYKVYIYIYN